MMQTRLALVVALAWAGAAPAQEKKPEPPPRFGVAAETELYPQTSPKTAMISITKAMQRNRMDYVLAHLTEPGFVDAKVDQFYRLKSDKTPGQDRDNPQYNRRLKEAFEDFMKEVNQHMTDNPRKSGYLEKLLKDGTIEGGGGTAAAVTHKDVPNFTLTMRQVEGRWYMTNEDQPERPK